MEYRGDEVAMNSQCEALEAEVAPLRAELATLNAKKEELLTDLARIRYRRWARLLAALFLGWHKP